jgi:hypothetical protein
MSMGVWVFFKDFLFSALFLKLFKGVQDFLVDVLFLAIFFESASPKNKASSVCVLSEPYSPPASAAPACCDALIF